MRSHLKVYFSFEEDAQALNDSEKARLLLAMLRYAVDGSESNLTGNERFLFPVFKAQIDRDIENYNTKVSNGSKGGRPKSEDNQEEPNETENNLNEPKITEIAKIEDRRYKIEDKRQKMNDGIDKPQKRFIPPTRDEVALYCLERHNHVDADRFVDYYTSNGWMVGKSKMKDWKAAVRQWERNPWTEEQYEKDKEMSGLPY